MICCEHTKKNPNHSHSLKATTKTPILPETANNGLNSSKTSGEVGKRWISHATRYRQTAGKANSHRRIVSHATHRRLVRQTVTAKLYHTLPTDGW